MDASELSEEQQKMLFLGNIRKHPKGDIAEVINGDKSVTDFWLDYHWAGPDHQRKAREKSFNQTLTEYDNGDLDSTIKPIAHEEVQPLVLEGSEPQAIMPQEGSQLAQQDQLSALDGSYSFLDGPEANQGNPVIARQQEQLDQSQLANGGLLNSFNGGGTHEQNPYGGIPVGQGPNGKMNTVEEGETSYDFLDDKYIFSNRLKI